MGRYWCANATAESRVQPVNLVALPPNGDSSARREEQSERLLAAARARRDASGGQPTEGKHGCYHCSAHQVRHGVRPAHDERARGTERRRGQARGLCVPDVRSRGLSYLRPLEDVMAGAVLKSALRGALLMYIGGPRVSRSVHAPHHRGIRSERPTRCARTQHRSEGSLRKSRKTTLTTAFQPARLDAFRACPPASCQPLGAMAFSSRPDSPMLRSSGSQAPSFTRVRAPGCYEYQVDGLGSAI